MILAAHQPNYLPNLGFFGKMIEADTFVVISNVQYSKKDGWVRRHRIPSAGHDLWLTVPTLGSSQSQQIRDVRIDNSRDWAHKHKSALANSYRRTPEFRALERVLAIYDQKWDRIADLNMALILCLKEILEIPTPTLLDEEVTGAKQNLMINLCQKYGADIYLSGQGGKIYMTDEYYNDLQNAGVTMQFASGTLTADYPYTALHYLFTEGIDAVQRHIGLTTERSEHSPVLA